MANAQETLNKFQTVLKHLGIYAAMELAEEMIKKFWDEWRGDTADAAVKHMKEWTMIKIFGIKTEDERRYNEALTLLDPNESDVITKRLGALSRIQPEMSDYYRLTIMQDTPEKMATILRQHAQMPEDVWQEHVRNMNLDLANANKGFMKFWDKYWPQVRDWLKERDKELGKVAGRIDSGNRAMQAAYDRRNRNWLTSLFHSFSRAFSMPHEGMDDYMAELDDNNTEDSNIRNASSSRESRGSNHPRRRKIGLGWFFSPGVWFISFGAVRPVEMDLNAYAQGPDKPRNERSPEPQSATQTPPAAENTTGQTEAEPASSGPETTLNLKH